MQQRKHVVRLQLVAPVQEVQLYDKGQPGNVRTQRLRQLGGRRGRSSRGEQVVHDQHALAFLNCVFVDFKTVAAVLEVVFHFHRGRGKLSRLAHWYEAGIQPIRQRRTKDESTRFHPEDQVDLLANVVFRKKIDELRESGFIFQQRGDVVKENSLFREIRYFANQLLQLVGIQTRHLPGSFNAKCCEIFRQIGIRRFYLIDPRRARPFLQPAIQS